MTGKAIAELSEQHALFIKEYFRTGSAVEAARTSGYGRPDVSASNLMRRPNIIAAIRAEFTRLLATDDAKLARDTLRRCMLDKGAPWNARVAAAKTVLDRAGFVPPTTQEKPADRPLNERSTTELAALIDRMEGELAARAKPVVAIPTPGIAPGWQG